MAGLHILRYGTSNIKLSRLSFFLFHLISFFFSFFLVIFVLKKKKKGDTKVQYRILSKYPVPALLQKFSTKHPIFSKGTFCALP